MMAWSVDQASLGTRVFEATYGDTSMTFTSNVNAAAGSWVMLPILWIFSDTLTTVTDNGPG
jgi:hypothetical protein